MSDLQDTGTIINISLELAKLLVSTIVAVIKRERIFKLLVKYLRRRTTPEEDKIVRKFTLYSIVNNNVPFGETGSDGSQKGSGVTLPSAAGIGNDSALGAGSGGDEVHELAGWSQTAPGADRREEAAGSKDVNKTPTSRQDVGESAAVCGTIELDSESERPRKAAWQALFRVMGSKGDGAGDDESERVAADNHACRWV